MIKSLYSVLVAFIMSLASALVFLAWNGWFGASDLFGFTVYSLPFLLLLYFLLLLFSRWAAERFIAVQYIAASMIGLLVGYLWTFSVAMFVGVWFRAFSIPVLYCWTIGALSAFLFSVVQLHKRSWPIAVATLVFLSLAAIFSFEALSRPPSDLLIILKEDVTQEEINQVFDEGIGRTTGRGWDYFGGIMMATRETVEGQQVVRVMFQSGATSEEREYVRSRALEMPAVVDVIDE